jgi:hypothetical protein
MDSLERFLCGFAILMSAAVLGIAYLFRFEGYYSAFGRLQYSLGYVIGPWVIAAAVAGLIWVGGNTMKFKVPLLEVFFTLVCGGCAVSILEALR